MNTRMRMAGLVGVFLMVASCNNTSPTNEPSVLAKIGSETLTVADLDAYLVSLPEKERWFSPGTAFEGWVEDKIRMLAIQRHFAQSEATKTYMASEKASAMRLMAKSQILTNLLNQALTEEVSVDEAQIKAQVQALQKRRSPEPMLNFQHMFFRTDRGDKAAVLKKAKRVAAEARDGADFTALVRQYSDSSNAQAGGIVQNVRPSDLDKKSRKILTAMKEGEVSDLVENRTGLHLFRLIRRIQPKMPAEKQLEQSVRAEMSRQMVEAHRHALLEELHKKIPIKADDPPWQIGSFSVAPAFLEMLGFQEGDSGSKTQIIELVLLSQEALDRGLGSGELDKKVEDQVRIGFLEQLFNQERLAHDAKLSEEVLQPFYQAQATLFTKPERTSLQLLFVPRGNDSFATQKILETHVAKLRNGASFDALVKDLSKGPLREQGGRLGSLTAPEWGRYSPAVAEIVPNLGVGEISDPIYCTERVISTDPLLLRGGFAIVKVLERQAEQPQRFQDALEDVRRAYATRNRVGLDRDIRDRILGEANFEMVRLPTTDELVQ